MYKGWTFETNKGVNCIVVEDNFNSKYVIVNMDDFSIVASDDYNNIENLIKTVTEKF